MIRNYFKIAWRNLVRHKGYAIINIMGLATGMAVAMLIGLWIWDELTYDNYHLNHKTLAQVETSYYNSNNEISTGDAVSMPLGEELRTKFAGDFKAVSMASWNFDHLVAAGEKKLMTKGMWVEANFPVMFSLKMIKGNINALNDPSSFIVSASLAKSLFGDEDPINKTVKFYNQFSLNVGGVFEDLPHNTTLNEVRLFLPWKKYITTEEWLKNAATQWNNHSWQAFVQVTANGDMEKISTKIKDVSMAHKVAATEGKESLLLHPMDKWRLYSEFKNGKSAGGKIQFVWLFAIIGVFVLCLACINFMNLSTARSEKRAKEVGIRKTVGSVKWQLIGQFLSESVVVAFLALIFAIVLVLLLMPLYNSLADKSISLPWSNVYFWLLIILFTVITGIVSGSYPAFFLSRFEPISVLKGTFKAGRFASLPRKILVVIQFTFSIALIIGTIVVFKQIQYARNRPVNYSREGLIAVPMNSPDLNGHYDAIRTDLLNTGAVENMAESSSPITNVYSNSIGYQWEGKDPNALPSFGTIAVTRDFGKTVGWQIKEGRDFSRDFATDTLGMILNESAVKLTGIKGNIIGKIIQSNDKNYSVIGVVKDMIMENPYKPVKATIFFYDPYWANVITIRLKQGVPAQEALSKVANVLKKYNPSSPFEYQFTDEEYAKKFSDEQRVGNLATLFTILAIFISCLGLFGLAAFVAEQRKKEIGVRKVLGATVFNLWQMLSKEFALLVLISCIIAVPVAWYYLNQWLQDYDYKTDISWWVLILACAGALIVTIITVSFQAIKAAIANPVKSLRTE